MTEIAEPGPAQRLFREREQRVRDAVALREPDRVPIFYYSMFWHAKYAGMSCRDAMYDYERLADAVLRIADEFQPDAVAAPFRTNAMGPAMELMDYRQMRWPGHGVDPRHSYQYIDQEYMSADEYDEYLDDPTAFYFAKYLPRIAGVFGPLAKLPRFHSLYHTHVVHGMQAFGDPEVEAALLRLIEIGRELRRMQAVAGRTVATLAERGFPMAQWGFAQAPYDLFADFFRGSKNAMLDMFRRKDKLLAAMDKIEPYILEPALKAATGGPTPIVFMPMHWGLDGFMSPRQFDTFFWPQLRRVMMALIERDLIPCVLWEGDVTSRLQTIRDIPAGKAIYWFERTDLVTAKQVLGDVVCLRGNVPASLLNTGTPAEVRECARRLIGEVGQGGGFILDGGIGIPDEAPLANVAALFEAARDFGRYR